MSTDVIKIRRAIVRLAVGDSTRIVIAGMSPAEVLAEVRTYSRQRRTPVDAKLTDDGVDVTRIEAAQRLNIYPEIDALELGQSHHFELPIAMHARIRQAASNRGRTHGVAYMCQRQGQGITVTRIPATPEERASGVEIDVPQRKTKWGLERLETEPRLQFELSAEDQMRLRLSVSRKAAITGWRIRCRKQDDGTMLVYRVDTDDGADTREALPPKVPPNYH